jgi:ketosteroid isomerase-like protein
MAHAESRENDAFRANLDKLERAYRNWTESRGGTAEEVVDLFADQAEMRSLLPAELALPVGGTRASKSQIREYFDALHRDWEMISFGPFRFIPAGDEIIAVGHCHWKSRRTGTEVATPKVDLWRFEDGKDVILFQLCYTVSFASPAGVIPESAAPSPSEAGCEARQATDKQPEGKGASIITDEAAPRGRMRNPNLVVIETLYRDWVETRGGNIDAIIAMMSDTVEKRSVMSTDINGELGGACVGKEKMRAFFESLVRDWELVDYPVERFIDGGDDIVMIGRCHWRARDRSAEFDVPKIDLWRFEGGKIVLFYEAFDTYTAAKALGSA